MLLARAAARQKEIAVRVSLGAGRARIVRQVLTESVLLSLAGAALGLVVAYYGAAALVAVIASGRPLPGLGPLVIHPAININVLLFTGVAAVLTGVLFGMAPVWHALAGAPMASLREIQATGETRSRRVFGKSLVAAQVALSVTVLSVAGLLVHHLSNLRNVDVGFERDSVLLVTVDPARSGYKATQLAHLYKDLLARLAAIPGVRSATMSAPTPIAGGAASRFIKVEGFEEDQDARRRVALTWIGPGYFETFRTAILAGRDFQPADESGPRVALVNRATARHYFGNRNPLGRRFTFEGETAAYEIVGVSGDAKYSDLHEPAPRTVYLNAFRDAPGRLQQFALRTSVPPLRVAGDVRGVIRDALKTVAVAKITTLADQVDASLVPERLIVAVSGLFAAFGALLASVGLYGLLSHAVARRVNEFGVRMALGATRRDIMRMVLEGALGLVGAGIVAGALLAIWSQRLAANLVANLPEDRLSPILVASILMIAVALLAACVPARRAARINPIDALRHL
jgi:predicted permease